MERNRGLGFDEAREEYLLIFSCCLTWRGGRWVGGC